MLNPCSSPQSTVLSDCYFFQSPPRFFSTKIQALNNNSPEAHRNENFRMGGEQMQLPVSILFENPASCEKESNFEISAFYPAWYLFFFHPINNLFRKQGDIEWFKNQISKSLFIWTNHIEYWDKLDVAKYFLKVVTEAQDYMTLIFVWKFKKVAVP